MSQVIGNNTQLLMAYESTFNTLPTDLTGKVYSLPFNTFGVAGSQNTTDASTITGRRESTEPILGNVDVSGDVVVPVDVRAMGYWLALAFGAPTTTADDTSGLSTHVFKPVQVQPSCVLEQAMPLQNMFIRKTGCKVSKISFSFGGDGELTATVSLVGCNETVESTKLGDATAVPLERLNNFQVSSLSIGGNEVSIVTNATIDIDFGLDTDGYAIGDKGFRSRINEGIIKVSGQVTAFFDDATFIDMATNTTTTSLDIKLTRGTKSFEIKLPELQFARNTPGIDGQAGISQQLDYSAFYGTNSDNTNIVCTLVNDVAAYNVA